MGQNQSNDSVEEDQSLPKVSAEDLAEEEIFGELDVSPETGKGQKVAELVMLEAHRMLNSTQNWKQISDKNGLKLEAKPIVGSGLLVYRATCDIAAPSRDFFDFLVSTEGFQAIDPFSDPKDFDQALLKFDYKTKCQVEYAFSKMPFPMDPRSFVVMNITDSPEREFASKSVYYSGKPGSSKFSEMGITPTGGNDIRLFAAFYLKTMDDPEKENCCKAIFVQYIDMEGWFTDGMSNGANKAFFKPLYERLQKKVQEG
mmetsp:Transcript_12757/g.16766  ORF Transcript_12757/g.16766 Transcript_12757/m.16766 type:complete len:257 (-) Transcript_12757:245-1015(-)|eukprot:CAMPEP_0117877260 /NCGR_PEP_ID=MMETSP0950-20121206/14091_1 /TAXON_ID=44440 /ORGANISM="Chattonella subsalsa, Strain CCMP2191" /LENGTH=256 /DNA_ID=CAMNT_0005731227 /DNA_START=48 /DNA_END=818 /DNA_ORIENTATION=-